MEAIIQTLTTLGAVLPILAAVGAAIAFLWGVYQFFAVRMRDAATRDFEAFHRLVKELVEPDEKTKTLYIDRQAAIVFELRHFKRYREFTLRMLSGLRTKWTTAPNANRVIEEIDLTIAYLEHER